MSWRYWQGVLNGIFAFFNTVDKRRTEGARPPVIFNLDGIPKVEVVIDPGLDTVPDDDDPGYEIPIEDFPSTNQLIIPISEPR
jgi:hypothetical protein